MCSQVLLPQGLALMLSFREYRRSQCLRNPLMAPMSKDLSIQPGIRTRDGSYTEMILRWQKMKLRIQSAHALDDETTLLMRVEALEDDPLHAGSLILELAYLWQRPGYSCVEQGRLTAVQDGQRIQVYVDGTQEEELWTQATGPHQVFSLATPLLLSASASGAAVQVEEQIEGQRQCCLQELQAAGANQDLVDGLHCGLYWNTIYEPVKQRVCTPVSRRWSCKGGGYSLFCWDTYFAAFMASESDFELAVANLVEITRESEGLGFVPNCAHRTFASRDRSQPCVGAMILRELYRRSSERWLCELLFEELLTWNRWWMEARSHGDELCWGSNAYEPRVGNPWESNGVHDRFGAALESGLDNSPLYDDIPFNPETHMLELADVGLMSLYVLDCEALADLASVLGRKEEALELQQRAARVGTALKKLWHEETGVFLNRRTDTGSFSPRIAPTNLYALLSGVCEEEQVERMLEDVLFHPEKLGGDWLLPSISRDDPAFADQDYWRGRIWAPMTFLVYLGLRRVNAREACRRLAENAASLFLKDWRRQRCIYENYCAIRGEGGEVHNADPFYHWGALLAVVALMEEGHLADPFPYGDFSL